MHERQFTQKIVDAILVELDKYADKKPRSVRVKVGEAYHLVPESVKMHFEILTKDTPLEGTSLELVEEAMEVTCSVCGKTGIAEDHHLLVCPFCYSTQVKAISGNRIIVESVVLENENSR